MFYNRYLKNVDLRNSRVCVGLDSDIEKIPDKFGVNEEKIFNFNKYIIDSTYENTNTYKLNIAFYEQIGYKGIKMMEKTVEYIKSTDTPIIIDCKRGDIGNTAKAYAKYYFDHLQIDSITVNPYMGRDSLIPYLEFKDSHIFILSLTSNKSAQDLIIPNKLHIKTSKLANELNRLFENRVGIVAGATQECIEDLDEITENEIYLIPGIGAQGGDLKALIKSTYNKNILINSSRGIIFSEDPKKSLITLKNNINEEIDIYEK